MSRILPDDVVEAYKATGVIPIRMAWITTDARGGCAIDTLARHYGVCTDDLRKTLDTQYEEGFLLAWDSDLPTSDEVVLKVEAEGNTHLRQGYCDGLLCRSAVESSFSSEIVAIHNDNPSES